MKNHQYFMNIAFKIAKQNKTDIPIGAVIVDNLENIIGKSKNKIEEKQNPISHAETECIQIACKKIHSKFLTNCSIYITLEPCPMCFYAICLAKIKNIYIGCSNPKTGAISNDIFKEMKLNHKPNIYFGIMEEENKKLLDNFFKSKRI